MSLQFFSAAKQDEFVANILGFKKSGYCVDIGSAYVDLYNNTNIFQIFDWNSITIEIDCKHTEEYKLRKNNVHLNEDALKINYEQLFEKYNYPKSIDYLSLDVDELSLDVLKIIPLDKYRFKVITIEHDTYLYGDKYRGPQRELLSSYGYTLLCSDVYVEQIGYEDRVCPFEDWWVDEKEFDKELLDRIRCDNKYPSQIIAKFQKSKVNEMNVTLYAIAKNEEKNVEKFIENSKKFPHTVVVDTGSTDNTVQLLKDAGIQVYEHPQTREEFDFAVARNQALSYVKTDWAFSLDFNEDIDEFSPEGFGVIADEFTTFRHLRFDDIGTEEPVQSNEVHTRFHRTENYKWNHAIHELPVFVPTEKYQTEVGVDTTIKITKKIKNSIDKELFYLSICERENKKYPKEWYYVWFIFNHYSKITNLQKALEYGQEFLNLSNPYFNTFRISAFIRLSIIQISLNDVQKGANYAFHALSEAMNMGEPYLSQAFTHLLEIGKFTKNPNIIVFASGFNPETLRLKERTDAIDNLFLNNLEDTPATAWSGHRNFAEWLVRFINPKVIVDLGVDWGYSTFSFALPRIGHVYGVDNFIGDDFVGNDENRLKYNFVNMKKEKLHLKDNITFIEGDFNEVAKTWDKKIDILHIDGSHHYEDVKKDFETWSQFVNDDGIILMHDTCVETLDKNGYGVKRFFEEIDLPKFTFTHCYGLGVICKNENLLNQIKNSFS